MILRTDGSDFGDIIVQVKYVQVRYFPDTASPSLPMIIGHSPLPKIVCIEGGILLSLKLSPPIRRAEVKAQGGGLSRDAIIYEVGGRQNLRSRPGKCGRQNGTCRAEGLAGRIA